MQETGPDSMILDAAKRELADRAPRQQASAAPLRSSAASYTGTPRVRSINLSAKKGTRKAPVATGAAMVVEQHGLADDAHAGHWHRQVSFLAQESIDAARERGLEVGDGAFGENFTTEGLNLFDLPVGTQLRLGDEVLVEISQIGKVCHTRCAIYYLAGDCIFPHEGIFGVVLRGGEVRVGDEIAVVRRGDGTCTYTPPEALAEVERARADGTL
ncbi:MAG: MOSC domain-containing protein [Coriobacteriaceae bacterium]|nr:MOSC domain-containing protein [Coriobacteriaceae bacterium]